jgi:hypothetical protein
MAFDRMGRVGMWDPAACYLLLQQVDMGLATHEKLASAEFK